MGEWVRGCVVLGCVGALVRAWYVRTHVRMYVCFSKVSNNHLALSIGNLLQSVVCHT